MARLRAFAANGSVVYDLLLEQKRSALRKARSLKMDQEILKKRNLFETDETFGNLTIFKYRQDVTIFKIN